MELDAILDNLSDEEQIELLELLEEEENYRNTHLLQQLPLRWQQHLRTRLKRKMLTICQWITNMQIYTPLAKSKGKILEQIRASRDENGKQSDKLHLFLSEIGVKALRQHIGKLLGVAAMSETREEYEKGIEKVFGRMKPEI